LGAGPVVSVNSSLFSGGSPTGWDIVQTVSIPHSGHVAVTVQLTNNTGKDARDVQWGVGFDPDQGGSGNNGTWNTIDALGNNAAVSAVSSDGWKITLHNTTSASADFIAPYIDNASFGFGSCCLPIDPNVMLTTGQGIGSYGFQDWSINLGYEFGFVPAGDSVTIGYEYVMAVPEPETYAMLLAGLGLIGFSARRRTNA